MAKDSGMRETGHQRQIMMDGEANMFDELSGKVRYVRIPVAEDAGKVGTVGPTA